MSETIRAERFDMRGRRVENVGITVNVVGRYVYLWIDNGKQPKHYAMTRAQWNQLTSARPIDRRP